MTDYDLLFKDLVSDSKKQISSISTLSTCKIVLNETGDGVKVFYKDDSSKPGWLPRPVLSHIRSPAWYKHFTKSVYAPHVVLDSYPRKAVKNADGLSIRVPEWVYKVKHSNGEIINYNIPVESLPFQQFPDNFCENVKNAIPQVFRGKLKLRRNQDRLMKRIELLLTKRGKYTDEAQRSWNAFFARLPKEDDLERPIEHLNVLNHLVRTYGQKRGKLSYKKAIPMTCF